VARRKGKKEMNKRDLITGGIAVAAVANILPAEAKKGGGSATFIVPYGVNRIRVRSYSKGEKVLDRSLNVVPGQTFVIDPV